MASVCDDPNGRRRIAFVAPSGDRKAIRLGKIDRKTADSIARHLEAILASKVTGAPISRETAFWVAQMPGGLKEKFVLAGLLEPERVAPTFAELSEKYFARKDIKDSTKSIRRYWQSTLAQYFGEKKVDQVDSLDGDGLRDFLLERDLEGATVGRMLRFARQIFTMAVREKWITVSPLESLAHNFREGQGKQREYIEAEKVKVWMDSAPAPWRTLVALARFGGLRAPSEALGLRWADVDLPNRKMTVTSPKTEAQGKAWRVVPIRPDLAEILEEAWDTAKDGAEFVVALDQYRTPRENGWHGVNVRQQFDRLTRMAGLAPIKKPFRIFRSSCLTDWAREFPIHSVAQWAGHTVQVAGKHYLTPLDKDFQEATKAAQKTAQKVAETSRNHPQGRKGRKAESVTVPGLTTDCDKMLSTDNYPGRIRTFTKSAKNSCATVTLPGNCTRFSPGTIVV